MTEVLQAPEIEDLRARLNDVSLFALKTGDVLLVCAPWSRNRGVTASMKTLLNRAGQALFRGSLHLSPYSHAAICLDRFTVVDADYGHTLGVRPLSEWITHYEPRYAMVFRHPAHAEKPRETRAAILHPYGRTYSLHPTRATKPTETIRTLYCSQFVDHVYRPMHKAAFDRRRQHLPIDLPKTLLQAGFVAHPLENLREAPAEGKLPSPLEQAILEPDWAERLGPLAGPMIDIIAPGLKAVAQLGKARFHTVYLLCLGSYVFIDTRHPGKASACIGGHLEANADLVFGDEPEKVLPLSFEQVEDATISPDFRLALLTMCVRLVLYDCSTLGNIISGFSIIAEDLDREANTSGRSRQTEEYLLTLMTEFGLELESARLWIKDSTFSDFSQAVVSLATITKANGSEAGEKLSALLIEVENAVRLIGVLIAPFFDLPKVTTAAQTPPESVAAFMNAMHAIANSRPVIEKSLDHLGSLAASATVA